MSPSSPLLVVLLLALLHPTLSQTCSTQTFSKNRVFPSCAILPRLSSSLHWSLIPATSQASIAFRAPLAADGWVSWGLNPTGQGMVGTQALVGVREGGSTRVFKTDLTSKRPNMIDGELKVGVDGLEAEWESGVMVIYARVSVPGNGSGGVGHTWQVGSVNSGAVLPHAFGGDNLLSTGTIDFASGSASGGGSSVLHKRNIHGILNGLSWGVLMPLGAIIARYLRVFESADPAWFYLHITCQVSGYIIGVAGWGTGLKLGSESKGVTQTIHRNIGISLFCLATLQVFALLLRPQKDHKFRFYWNIYHHSVGYSVIVLSIINIFRGFNILNPVKQWKHAYIGILIGLAVVVVILEIFTWIVVLKRKSRKNTEKTQNGYGARV